MIIKKPYVKTEQEMGGFFSSIVGAVSGAASAVVSTVVNIGGKAYAVGSYEAQQAQKALTTNQAISSGASIVNTTAKAATSVVTPVTSTITANTNIAGRTASATLEEAKKQAAAIMEAAKNPTPTTIAKVAVNVALDTAMVPIVPASIVIDAATGGKVNVADIARQLALGTASIVTGGLIEAPQATQVVQEAPQEIIVYEDEVAPTVEQQSLTLSQQSAADLAKKYGSQGTNLQHPILKYFRK